jgi:hypothetical protein
VDAATAEQIQRGLLEEGYIEPSGSPFGPEHWHLTLKGSALANARARKPITRKTAERLIEEFLARVREVNAGDYAYRVRRVIVFGSFLSDSADLGDVDLSIELEDRYADPDARQGRPAPGGTGRALLQGLYGGAGLARARGDPEAQEPLALALAPLRGAGTSPLPVYTGTGHLRFDLARK